MRATSLLIGSNPDKITASGVSSIIRSTPVSVSSVRILRPSRPIILPFISSFGSWTTEMVVSATWSAAHFWIAVTTYSFAFLSASSLALCSISLINFAVSSFTSSSTVFKRYSFACSEVNPEILSSSCNRSSLSFATCAFCLLISSSFAAKPASRLSIDSSFLSRFSSFCTTRRSLRWISARRSFTSLSRSFFTRMDSSFASSIASRFLVSAVFTASSIISLAFSSAFPILASVTFLW